MTRPPLDRDEVRHRRAEAAQAWSDALGDATSCTLAKDGRSHPTAKFHEGRTAALGELLRRLGPGADADPGAIEAAAVTLGAAWTARILPGGGDRDWDAYRAGGVEALRALAGA